MKSFYNAFLVSFLIAIITSCSVLANTDQSPQSNNLLTIYIDCSSCDYDFLRRDIAFVDLVRDRKQADVHILVSRQDTGGGGEEYTVEFIGRKDFELMVDTLKISMLDSDTDDMIRKKLSKTFKLGLIRYISQTDLADDISIRYAKPAISKEVIDKWNKWVFNIDLNLWMRGQKHSRSINVWSRVRANRITEQLKVELSAYFKYDESKTDYDYYKSFSLSRSKGTNGEFIFAIDKHWSYRFGYNVKSATYNNIDFASSIDGGLEYNIYPYEESSRRQLRFQYYLGSTYNDYTEETIFFKTNEWLFNQSMNIRLALIQPWGTINASVYGSTYMHDLSKNYVQLYTSLSLRLVEGFSLNIRGNVSRVRNQLSLANSGATEEEILLRRKELATTYNYWVSMGITYSFGSIYNNIVNPRFD